MSLRHLPNLLCVLRILLIYPVAKWIVQGHYPQVLVLFALAAFTDALDGFLAKRFGWSSEIGKVLDPLADKLLLVTVFVSLALVDLVPLWLVGVVLFRDFVIFFGAIAFKLLFGPLRGQPTAVSKFNTLCQIVFCLAVVAHAGFGMPGDAAVIALGALVVVSTGVSGIDYTLTYTRRAGALTRAQSAAPG